MHCKIINTCLRETRNNSDVSFWLSFIAGHLDIQASTYAIKITTATIHPPHHNDQGPSSSRNDFTGAFLVKRPTEYSMRITGNDHSPRNKIHTNKNWSPPEFIDKKSKQLSLDILKFKDLIYKTGVQACSQEWKSDLRKCAIGPAQMNIFLRQPTCRWKKNYYNFLLKDSGHPQDAWTHRLKACRSTCWTV